MPPPQAVGIAHHLPTRPPPLPQARTVQKAHFRASVHHGSDVTFTLEPGFFGLQYSEVHGWPPQQLAQPSPARAPVGLTP